MSGRRLLLINPRITSRRSARFPLSLLALAGYLQPEWPCRVIDGNVDGDYLSTIRHAVAEERFVAVGVTVMGGPQVQTGIEASMAVRAASPETPIIWGGYFPTLYPDSALNASYVDFTIRGPGEAVFAELLRVIRDPQPHSLAPITGLSWKHAGRLVRNPDRVFRDVRKPSLLPYELLGDPRDYLGRTFLGRRTVAHQASVGCRFRCTFCGVAAMFGGATGLPPAARLERELRWLKDEVGADSIQFFDHNFFDREADMVPLLEVLAQVQMPWWCYARADALLGLSSDTWSLVRASRMRMAYIGAESPNDAMLKAIRKGTQADQTLEVAELCRRQGVIPELSFMVAPPEDTEAETERTFEFIRKVKQVNPHAEIIVYIYTPLPPECLPANSRSRARAARLHDVDGSSLQFPQTPAGWTERRWVDYACHANAPWVSAALLDRIQSFVTVLGCRFPTIQDVRSPPWSKLALSLLASWRYRYRRYDRPWELSLSRKLIRLADPRVTSI